MKAITFLYPNPLRSAYYTLSYFYFAFCLMVFLETGSVWSMTFPGHTLKTKRKWQKALLEVRVIPSQAVSSAAKGGQQVQESLPHKVTKTGQTETTRSRMQKASPTQFSCQQTRKPARLPSAGHGWAGRPGGCESNPDTLSPAGKATSLRGKPSVTDGAPSYSCSQGKTKNPPLLGWVGRREIERALSHTHSLQVARPFFSAPP